MTSSCKGNRGPLFQEVGFDIDPAKQTPSHPGGGVGYEGHRYELDTGGVVIQGSGNAQLELNNTQPQARTLTAITTVIDPQTALFSPRRCRPTEAVRNNTLTDAGGGPLNYLYGADGTDTS
jgi:hypothetical protein